jgi:hypothetical protein
VPGKYTFPSALVLSIPDLLLTFQPVRSVHFQVLMGRPQDKLRLVGLQEVV